MKTTLPRLLIATAFALAAGCAAAADLTPSGPAASDKLAAARAQIAEKKWVAAIEELKRVGDTGSADWNNLMGYSHRKAKTPDYAAAERYYDEALLGLGELYLMTGDLAKAEQRLAALDKACLLPCAEYTELKKAVAAYKANGDRVVAAP